MDFWKDIWPTLIAPFIVVILTPIANAIGNKMFKNWGFKGVLAILIILALTLFFFLNEYIFPSIPSLQLNTSEWIPQGPIPYTILILIGAAILLYLLTTDDIMDKIAIILFCLFILIILIIGYKVLGMYLIIISVAIICGAAYYFTVGGGDIGTLQEKVQELITSMKPKK